MALVREDTLQVLVGIPQLIVRDILKVISPDICYPFDLCYSKCRVSTDRIKQGDLVFNVYYL